MWGMNVYVNLILHNAIQENISHVTNKNLEYDYYQWAD